jgi:hypothetical protein
VPDANSSIIFWTAIAGVSAVATVIVTALSVRMSYVMWRSQNEPKVIVYVRHDRDRSTMLHIVIENIGRDIASDITFTPSRPIPANAFGMEQARRPIAAMNQGPLVHGVRSLGPGDRREVVWGQYGGLTDALNNGSIDLRYDYRYGRRKLSGSAVLDVESFQMNDASATPASDTARHIDSLAKSISRIQDSLRWFEITSKADRNEQKALRKHAYLRRSRWKSQRDV